MNEKLQYADMLNLPINTCNVTLKPKKKRLFKRKPKKKTEDVKQELLNKVNSMQDEREEENNSAVAQVAEETLNPIEEDGVQNGFAEPTATVSKKDSAPKRKIHFKISGFALCLIVIGVLLSVIFLTNAFYPNSGINGLINSVFGNNNTAVAITDNRTYEDFKPVITFDGTTSGTEDGILNFTGKGSIYSVADGKVLSSYLDEEGKYILEIAHSDNFVTVLSGLDFSYVSVGDIVYSNIPVGYIKEELSMCFKNGDSIITDYQINDNAVLWGK